MKLATPKRIYWLFVGTFIGLCLQFYVAIHISEPYPAVLLPFFSWVGPNNGIYTNMQGKFVSITPTDSLLFTQDDFFYDLPISHRYVVMNRLFSLKSDSLVYHNSAFKQWLRQRAQQLSHTDSITNLSVVWQSTTYNTNELPLVKTNQILGQKQILF